jgi:hypothetical protein
MESVDVLSRSPLDAPRRAPSGRIAPWVEYLSAASADEEFYRRYRLVIERADEDGSWHRRSARGLTAAQRSAHTMVMLWEQALATLKAWERAVSWATEERVIEDCLEFIEFVGRAASELEPRILH